MGRGEGGVVVTGVLDSLGAAGTATVSDVSTAGGVVLLSEPLAAPSDVSCSDSGTRGALGGVGSWGVEV